MPSDRFGGRFRVRNEGRDAFPGNHNEIFGAGSTEQTALAARITLKRD